MQQLSRVITGLLLAATAATAQLAVAAEEGRAQVDFLAALEALRVDRSIPGLSVAVVRDGEVILAAGLGVADVETGRPATAQTAYDAASVTKPLSAVVALRMAEAGLVDLDRPVAEYSDWPRFCGAFSERPSIFARDLVCEPAVHTLRHLLTHTAAGTPGAAFSYNPILYSWASRPLMAVADEPFSTLVERHVFAPAGMTESARRHRALALPEAVAARLAPPHRLDEQGAVVRAPALDAQGDGAAGGVITTVLDLARFDIALDRGELLSPASLREMTTPTRALDGAALPYGVGFYLQEYAGRELVWHAGWWEEAYSALYLKLPAERLTLVLLANSEGMWWGNPLTGAEVERSLFAQAFLEAFPGPAGAAP